MENMFIRPLVLHEKSIRLVSESFISIQTGSEGEVETFLRAH